MDVMSILSGSTAHGQAFILLSPLLAALDMSFSSVTVVANANRLKRWRPS